MRVVSQFDIDSLECGKLDSAVFQLAILLYPTDLYNEKFLIKMRDCILNLKKDHLLKKWLNQLSQKKNYTTKENDKISYINEILNSPFNLITDQKIKNEVIDLISEIPENTVVEKLIRSYLYLMIGNITQSDNTLKSIMSMAPREFYRGFKYKHSIYHDQGLVHLNKIFEKLSNHPTDRLTFFVFLEYLKSYTNSAELLQLIDSLDVKDCSSRLFLRYTESIAPELISFLKVKKIKSLEQTNLILKKKFSFELLAYWMIPFLETDLLFSQEIGADLKKIENGDMLWHSYLMTDEKMADFYIKNNGGASLKRREELRDYLKTDADFMLSLYRLIQLGDIDTGLVEQLIKFQSHD